MSSIFFDKDRGRICFNRNQWSHFSITASSTRQLGCQTNKVGIHARIVAAAFDNALDAQTQALRIIAKNSSHRRYITISSSRNKRFHHSRYVRCAGTSRCCCCLADHGGLVLFFFS
jgi:hypothetical protein